MKQIRINKLCSCGKKLNNQNTLYKGHTVVRNHNIYWFNCIYCDSTLIIKKEIKGNTMKAIFNKIIKSVLFSSISSILISCNGGGSGSSQSVSLNPDTPINSTPFNIMDEIEEHNNRSPAYGSKINYDICKWIGEELSISNSGSYQIYLYLTEYNHKNLQPEQGYIVISNHGLSEWFMSGYDPVDDTVLHFISANTDAKPGHCYVRTNANTFGNVVNVWWYDNNTLTSETFKGVREF